MATAPLSPARCGTLLAVAALQLLPALVFLDGRAPDLPMAVWMLGSLAAGAFLVGSLVREGGIAARLALGAVAFAVVFAWLNASPFHVAIGLAMGGAVAALMLVDAVGAGLAGAGVTLETIAFAVLMQARGLPGENVAVAEYLALAGVLVATSGIVVAILRAPRAPTVPLGLRARLAFVIGGTAVLALSFALGGHLLFLPLWPLAFILLLVPPLVRWRALGLSTALVAAIALIGLAPVGECTVDPWSDAVPPVPVDDTRRERATLYEMAGSGPGWSEGGGFSGQTVHCPVLAMGAAVAWALALIAACFFCARREART